MKRLSAYLSALLRPLGTSVASHPAWYIVVSTFVSLLLSTGILHVREENNYDKLYYDFGSESAEAWRFMDQHFPVNYSNFRPDRYGSFSVHIKSLQQLYC